ncbi:MAG: glutathione S-transferase family protein [Candidatus Baltobacteraceae bacterium]
MTTFPQAQFPDEQSADGSFVRQHDAFRAWVGVEGNSGLPAVAGRYRLYVSLACPWAHRTIVVRALKSLEEAVEMTVVDPVRDERGWHLGDWFLSEAYYASDPDYRGRVTVPVLWDTHTKRIVSNSDDDIMRMFETQFDAIGNSDLDLYPKALRAEIDALNAIIYDGVNNGVYEAGFATEQAVYEKAAYRVFSTLDMLDERLASNRYLFGPRPLESDWRLFVTLIRFDAVYFGHFKCNLRRIVDYPNLSGYLRDLYQVPGVAPTVNFDHIKRHYYYTHDDLNPTRIVPIGPLLDLDAPHGRAHFGTGLQT